MIAGPDGRDLACLQSTPPGYLTTLDQDVAGIRLAWTADFRYAGSYAASNTPAVLATVREAAFSLADASALVENIDDVWEDPNFLGRARLRARAERAHQSSNYSRAAG